MKKVLAGILGLIVAAYPLSFAFADTLCPSSNGTGINANGFNGLCNLSVQGLISSLVTLIFILATVVALFYLIWGGFKWLTSGGDSKAVETARSHIVAAIIGLVIIFLSYVILNFVIGFFIPGFSLSHFQLPDIQGGTINSGQGNAVSPCGTGINARPC